uniref:Uncharacterized protein n=1 Tax=Eimeria tenella TaxID=5802 RepID=H9B9U7_EIMTE|nr:hypothetical protein [Eimeria tenella]
MHAAAPVKPCRLYYLRQFHFDYAAPKDSPKLTAQARDVQGRAAAVAVLPGETAPYPAAVAAAAAPLLRCSGVSCCCCGSGRHPSPKTLSCVCCCEESFESAHLQQRRPWQRLPRVPLPAAAAAARVAVVCSHAAGAAASSLAGGAAGPGSSVAATCDAVSVSLASLSLRKHKLCGPQMKPTCCCLSGV